jgi:magnesium transporter
MEEAEVAEVEMLLEAYDLHMEQTLSRLQTLDEFIQDTEDLVNTALDQKRNEVWINSVTGFCEGD